MFIEYDLVLNKLLTDSTDSSHCICFELRKRQTLNIINIDNDDGLNDDSVHYFMNEFHIIWDCLTPFELLVTEIAML